MAESIAIDDLDVRRRRALWRATHRGTRELDILIGTFAAAHLPAMDAAELTRFEEFLTLPETELQARLLAPEMAGEAPFADVVAAIRSFHGLTSA